MGSNVVATISKFTNYKYLDVISNFKYLDNPWSFINVNHYFTMFKTLVKFVVAFLIPDWISGRWKPMKILVHLKISSFVILNKKGLQIYVIDHF